MHDTSIILQTLSKIFTNFSSLDYSSNSYTKSELVSIIDPTAKAIEQFRS